MSQEVVVVAWGEQSNELPAGVEEVLTIGRGLAADLAGELVVLVLGSLPSALQETAGRHGVGRIDHIDDPKLAGLGPDACVDALSTYARDRAPRAILLHQTIDARVVAPRTAGRIDGAVVTNCVSVAPEGSGLSITATAFGGDTRRIYEVAGPSPVLVFTANACVPKAADSATTPEVNAVPVDLSATQERIALIERSHFDGPRLDDAEIIVSGGRGLQAPENYKLIEQLAEALGGLAGASRPIVDDGWTDSSHQVGLTGRITRPKLYIAVGISGASQHMAGCSAAKTLVAINKDEDAAIFQHAKYGIVGDCLEILPELIKAAAER